MRQIFKLLLTCTVAGAGLAACGGGTSLTAGQVRLVNATTEFTSLDLYQSSTQLSSGTASNSVGPYADIDRGTYTFNVNSGGATAASVSGEIDKKDDYTVVATTAGGVLTATFLSDNEGSPSSGTAKLRIFNADAADVSSVDVYLVATPCASLSTSSAAAVATAITGLQASYSQVTAAGGGSTYHACITATGDKSDLRLDIPALKLSDQQVVTLVLTHTSGGVLLNGLLLQQQGSVTPIASTSARIRVASGVSAPSTVTATANGVSLGTGLPAPGVGSYKLVDAGALTLNLSVGGNVVDASSAAPLVAGTDNTLLVTGNATTAKATVITDDNSISTSTARPVKIRLVNGMNGVTSAILTDDFNNIGDAAPFGGTSGYAQVVPSAALARIEATSGVTSLCLAADVTLATGSVYSVFLLGDPPTTTATCTIRVDR